MIPVRSAGALHRLLDVLPVFLGDPRIATRFTLAPGSDFGVEALAALDRSGARTVPWQEALRANHDLVLAASPKGELRELSGPRVLLPHGAGFNKAVRDDGSPGVPSGLDPAYLLPGGTPWADLHALAHDNQVALLTHHCPSLAGRASVVGDPTLDRLLVSTGHRSHYRDALGTGRRRLVVLTSTWGPESLLSRRPGLPGELVALLPQDAFQVALVLHPNEHSRTGAFDLSRQLAPALAAGLVLSRPYEEWAALLVAADTVITDHGSTALYAAALGRPVVNAYDGGNELLPGSPMARLLARSPRLAEAGQLEEVLVEAARLDTRPVAEAAFARQGEALPRLQRRLYRMLGLRPVAPAPEAQAFPAPTSVDRRPAAHAVRTELDGRRIIVERFPPQTPRTVHHLAAEHPKAGPRAVQSAAVLWRCARPTGPAGPRRFSTTWTAAGWTAHVLEEAPLCRTAAAVLSAERCLLRHRSYGLLSIRLEPHRAGGRMSRIDPVAAVSAVHAWLSAAAPAAVASAVPVVLTCETAPLIVRVHVYPPAPEDLDHEL
ncbi:translation initiation factor 2 [Kitasatospora sp. NPDC091335]|uniref:translation initiation factor 2 n=1 Tax=Kitasatospora sp. NPDC091335 TaxID=3364085 RepID=UPI00381990FE